MFYYFHFANYFRMVGLAWNEPDAVARRRYLAVLLVSVPLVAVFHSICFFLDPILFPSLRRTQVREPVFVLGHARSGTTLTHRLMSQDSGRFSSFVLYELYFPSLLQKRFIRLVACLDARWLAGFLGRRVRRWEEKRYAAVRQVHKMGLNEPEEDDIVLYSSCASGYWITKLPYMDKLDFYSVDDWPPRKRRRLMRFYKECVRRQLHLNGPHKIHLSKNPIFAGRVEALIETFPDARIVVNVRNPYETIPSLLKLVSGAWKQMDWAPERVGRSLTALADQSLHTYRHPLEVLERHPETRHAILDYRRLIEDPAATLERTYADLGIPVTDAYREVLLAAGKKARKHVTKHSYSLDEFGLDANAIHNQLADLFERFGWDAEQGDA